MTSKKLITTSMQYDEDEDDGVISSLIAETELENVNNNPTVLKSVAPDLLVYPPDLEQGLIQTPLNSNPQTLESLQSDSQSLESDDSQLSSNFSLLEIYP